MALMGVGMACVVRLPTLSVTTKRVPSPPRIVKVGAPTTASVLLSVVAPLTPSEPALSALVTVAELKVLLPAVRPASVVNPTTVSVVPTRPEPTTLKAGMTLVPELAMNSPLLPSIAVAESVPSAAVTTARLPVPTKPVILAELSVVNPTTPKVLLRAVGPATVSEPSPPPFPLAAYVIMSPFTVKRALSLGSPTKVLRSVVVELAPVTFTLPARVDLPLTSKSEVKRAVASGRMRNRSMELTLKTKSFKSVVPRKLLAGSVPVLPLIPQNSSPTEAEELTKRCQLGLLGGPALK